jgi:hypothetical protein
VPISLVPSAAFLSGLFHVRHSARLDIELVVVNRDATQAGRILTDLSKLACFFGAALGVG